MLNKKRLFDILSTRRGNNSTGENYIIKKHIDCIRGMQIDNYGNRYLVLADDTGFINPVLFTSHTDTVHNPKYHKKIQKVTYDIFSEEVYLENPGKVGATCLGSDCGTGIEIMLCMIESGMSGYYAFFRDEEIGGVGSSHFVNNPPIDLDKIDICISFDRKGIDSIITYQNMSRCCSDKFVDSLALQLGELNYKGDTTGSFTDSANFTDYISECTNLSVGYYNQHTPSEYQDVAFLESLIIKLCTIDYSKLIVSRDCTKHEDLFSYGSLDIGYGNNLADMSYDELSEWIYNNTTDAADLLYSYINPDEDLDQYLT